MGIRASRPRSGGNKGKGERIVARINAHIARTAELVAQDMDKEAASKQAFKEAVKPGIRLRKLRKKLFRTQAAAAIELGVTNRTVSAWETGVNPVPLVVVKYLLLLIKQRKEPHEKKREEA